MIDDHQKGLEPSAVTRPQHEDTLSKRRSPWQKVYTALGFQKGYNFILFFILAGAMLGFSLARVSFINVSGTAASSFRNNAAPGEWYWYRYSYRQIGMFIHLAAIIPAGLLMVWQFIPVIRRRFLLFHRINGYLIMLLVLLGNVGALMVCRRAFGGTIETQAGVGVLVIITTASIGLAYYNIKRLQIDQHRAWMLRAMIYLGSIITLRVIMILSALISTKSSNYYSTLSCDHIRSIEPPADEGFQQYPQCVDPNTPGDRMVAVPAKFGVSVSQTAASMDLSFGMALWMALFLHVVGVEIYLALTPRENNRLRQISYERQLEQGLKNPGSAGITADRWGDADPWKPASSY